MLSDDDVAWVRLVTVEPLDVTLVCGLTEPLDPWVEPSSGLMVRCLSGLFFNGLLVTLFINSGCFLGEFVFL